MGVKVYRGMTHDGLGKYLSEVIEKAPGPTDDVVGILKDTKTDVVVNYLPVGSEMATKWYVEQILEAGCGLVNCIPVFIAREKYWQERFEESGLPVIGDDIKSQVGATIVHRVLTRLMRERGVSWSAPRSSTWAATPTFSTCWSGSAWRARRSPRPTRSPRSSTTTWASKNIHIGPSDYVEWLDDRKWAYIRMEGRTFGDVPLNIELSWKWSTRPTRPASSSTRCGAPSWPSTGASPGALYEPASYFMKSPPIQYSDDEARQKTEAFIAGRGNRAPRPRSSADRL